jgi:hypothetical protein
METTTLPYRAVLISEDGYLTPRSYKDYKDMNRLIGAEYGTVVTVPGLGDENTRIDLWVDDEGLLTGRKYNPTASGFCGQTIMGHALVTAVDPNTGESKDLPHNYHRILLGF